MGDVVWHLAGQLDEVERIVRRGTRYVILNPDDPAVEGKDLQVGDVLALWPGNKAGDGPGIAVKLLHCTQLQDRKDRPEWSVWACSEPHEARLVDDTAPEDTYADDEPEWCPNSDGQCAHHVHEPTVLDQCGRRVEGIDSLANGGPYTCSEPEDTCDCCGSCHD